MNELRRRRGGRPAGRSDRDVRSDDVPWQCGTRACVCVPFHTSIPSQSPAACILEPQGSTSDSSGHSSFCFVLFLFLFLSFSLIPRRRERQAVLAPAGSVVHFSSVSHRLLHKSIWMRMQLQLNPLKFSSRLWARLLKQLHLQFYKKAIRPGEN